MAFYVYILRSGKDQSYYRGFSEHPTLRLQQHNNGESAYTKGKMPWELVFLQEFPTKREALIREKMLKKYSRSQIRQLLESDKNCLREYLGNPDL